MALENVCVVIDMDGFCIGKKFYPRELGYASLNKNHNQSYRFKLNRFARDLTEKDWKTVRYCSRYVHGLTFLSPPWEKDLFWVEHLQRLVRNVYLENKTREKYLVAYKGGHFERDLLDEMEIPSVDLEDHGCPKYDSLPEPDRARDCGHHDPATRGGRVHCPKLECRAFAEWIKKELLAKELFTNDERESR